MTPRPSIDVLENMIDDLQRQIDDMKKQHANQMAAGKWLASILIALGTFALAILTYIRPHS